MTHLTNCTISNYLFIRKKIKSEFFEDSFFERVSNKTLNTNELNEEFVGPFNEFISNIQKSQVIINIIYT
jgi:hypothetical protein